MVSLFLGAMKVVFVVFASIVHCVIRLIKPNGTRQLVVEMILLRAQLLAVRRKRRKAPPLTPFFRLVMTLAPVFVPLRRLRRISVVIRPQTILNFHRLLVKRKYTNLFGNKNRGKRLGRPPIAPEIRKLVLEIKSGNPTFGCPQISRIVMDRTGVAIDDETVRRILMKTFKPRPGSGPSWLSFMSCQADSLWSCDLFCAESITLHTYWILVVMDQYSRKITGFAISSSPVNGEALCPMFNDILGTKNAPKRLSHDNDPLFRFEQWTRNMAILEIDEVWSMPFVPVSNPFCERLIGTVRREYLDRVLFWNLYDLKSKLGRYRDYFNKHRVHSGIGGRRPHNKYAEVEPTRCAPSNLTWTTHCNGLFRLPEAA